MIIICLLWNLKVVILILRQVLKIATNKTSTSHKQYVLG